jgi:hypothetical protein
MKAQRKTRKQGKRKGGKTRKRVMGKRRKRTTQKVRGGTMLRDSGRPVIGSCVPKEVAEDIISLKNDFTKLKEKWSNNNEEEFVKEYGDLHSEENIKKFKNIKYCVLRLSRAMHINKWMQLNDAWDELEVKKSELDTLMKSLNFKIIEIPEPQPPRSIKKRQRRTPRDPPKTKEPKPEPPLVNQPEPEPPSVNQQEPQPQSVNPPKPPPRNIWGLMAIRNGKYNIQK